MARLSCRGELGRVERGGEQAVPTVGQDAGRLESRGWRRDFTLRSYFHPRSPLPSPPPVRTLPRWRGSSGAGKGPGSGARDMRGQLCTARTREPHLSRPGPHNTLQAIALGAMPFLTARGVADRATLG
jgi:hypothetical protein